MQVVSLLDELDLSCEPAHRSTSNLAHASDILSAATDCRPSYVDIELLPRGPVASIALKKAAWNIFSASFAFGFFVAFMAAWKVTFVSAFASVTHF